MIFYKFCCSTPSPVIPQQNTLYPFLPGASLMWSERVLPQHSDLLLREYDHALWLFCMSGCCRLISHAHCSVAEKTGRRLKE